MKRIYVPTSSAQDWQRLLAQPTRQWKAGYSAMTIARCWDEAPDGLPTEIGALFSEPRLLLAVPEYKVELKGGTRPTQTDLFALLRDSRGLTALAVEGKVDETFGPLISERTREPDDVRLDYLHALLHLDRTASGNLRYQLLHRTAAALLLARDFNANSAAMVVHSFSPDNSSWSDFQDFCEAFGAHATRGRLIQIRDIEKLPVFVGWAVGDQRFREAIPGT